MKTNQENVTERRNNTVKKKRKRTMLKNIILLSLVVLAATIGLTCLFMLFKKAIWEVVGLIISVMYLAVFGIANAS